MTALVYIDPPTLNGRPINGTLNEARRARPSRRRWNIHRIGAIAQIVRTR